MGLFCAVNTEFYQFEPIFFSLGCSCICIWSSGVCDRSRQGSALPHPAVCWLWPWRYGRYGRYGGVLQVDPSGSGGEVTQELQLSSLSIHSPRMGTLSTFLGQFKARVEEIQAAPHFSPWAVA